MKRAFACLLAGSLFAASVSARAADAVTLAAQQELSDNYKRLTATVEELVTTQAAQQRQISALAAELNKLREDMARNNNDAAHKESIRRLSEQILKVDEARVADNKRMLDGLERLGETIKKMPLTTPRRTSDAIVNGGGTTLGKVNTRPSNNAVASGSPSEEGYPYEVVSGDNASKIAAKFRAEGVKVTSESIIAANPGIEWTRLQVGQKLFIPKPKS